MKQQLTYKTWTLGQCDAEERNDLVEDGIKQTLDNNKSIDIQNLDLG